MYQGRSSARETISRVAAGAIASKVLKERAGTDIVSWVSSIGDIKVPLETEAGFCKKIFIEKEANTSRY